MNTKEIKEKIDSGYLRINIIFEVVGKPKEHVEKTIKVYIENIKKEEDLHILKEEYEPAEDAGEELFSTIAELEMLVSSFEKLTWLCINFSPASVEILEPAKLTIEQKEITHWLNDLLSKLHEIGMVQKTVRSQVDGLIRNFNAMTRNAILLVLKEPATMETISKKIGMPADHAEKFIDALIKEKRIKKDKNTYQLLN